MRGLISAFMTVFLVTAAEADVKEKTFKFSRGIEARFQLAESDGADELEFFKNGENMECGFKDEPDRSFFHGVVEVKVRGYKNPLYISDWGAGVHGERFIVFDPLKDGDCVLQRFDSGHPMSYAVEGDHLKVTIPQFDEDQKELPAKVVTWKPTGSSKRKAPGPAPAQEN